MTVDDLKSGDRIRFHDISVGAVYEGVLVEITDGRGLKCRDWQVVAQFGRPVSFPRMTVDGLWYIKNLTDIEKL